MGLNMPAPDFKSRGEGCTHWIWLPARGKQGISTSKTHAKPRAAGGVRHRPSKTHCNLPHHTALSCVFPQNSFCIQQYLCFTESRRNSELQRQGAHVLGCEVRFSQAFQHPLTPQESEAFTPLQLCEPSLLLIGCTQSEHLFLQADRQNSVHQHP